MGLIKTGLTLAGGYGLIKAASKAANDYEDKKQKRQSQNQFQQYPHPQQNIPGREPQLSYMYANQTNNAAPQPQWSSPYEPQPVYGGQMSQTTPQTQSRAIEPQVSHVQRSSNSPSSTPGFTPGTPGVVQPGTAHEYYSGKQF